MCCLLAKILETSPEASFTKRQIYINTRSEWAGGVPFMSPKNQQTSGDRLLASSKPEVSVQEEAPGGDGMLARKRRRQSETTVNACIACRKKRTKCDGNKPCLKCSSLPGSICAYDVNTRVSKEEMKLEIVDLRRSNSLATQILAALAEDRGVSRILQGLKDREELASIAAAINSSPGDSSTALESNDSPLSEAFDESPLDSLMDTGPDDFQGSSHAAGGHLGSGFRGEPSTEGKKNNPLPWTTPLLNDILIKHLLSLYWVWIHPAYPILNIGKFFEDFENCRTKHCSAYLVNAVCAAACDLLNPHWEGVPGKTTDVAALKQHLIAEAAIQAAQADPEAATTANASAVMSLINKERFPLIQAD